MLLEKLFQLASPTSPRKFIFFQLLSPLLLVVSVRVLIYVYPDLPVGPFRYLSRSATVHCVHFQAEKLEIWK